MARSAPGWVKGCAVGCGDAFVLFLGVLALGYLFVKGTIDDFDRADAAISTVENKFGPVIAFKPAPGGIIPAERMEAFLEARELTAESRAVLQDSLEFLSVDESEISLVIEGFKLPGLITEFVTLHNDALLQVGMGHGEYHYIYTLAYYSLLGHSPADGPSFQLVGENGYVLETLEPVEEPVVRERREEMVRRGVNRLTLPALGNALTDPTVIDDSEMARWRATLETEIAAMEADPLRIPWQDGIPESLEASILPYRERLEDSYDPMTSALEVGILRR